MEIKGIKNSLEFLLYTILACEKTLPNPDSLTEVTTDYHLIEDITSNIDQDTLISSDKNQKSYITYGYINDVYREYQILCPSCNSDKISQDGSKNGDIKFKCKNKNCGTKYFYLKPFVHKKVTEEKKLIASWLSHNNFPQKYIAQICGVHSTTIKNWLESMK